MKKYSCNAKIVCVEKWSNSEMQFNTITTVITELKNVDKRIVLGKDIELIIKIISV